MHSHCLIRASIANIEDHWLLEYINRVGPDQTAWGCKLIRDLNVAIWHKGSFMYVAYVHCIGFLVETFNALLFRGLAERPENISDKSMGGLCSMIVASLSRVSLNVLFV